MTQQLSVKIPDELDAQLRSAAGGNVSQWVVEAIQDRLDREMWEQSKQVDAALGITEEWMYEQLRARDAVRSEALRSRGDA
ncbi:hypothetical protein [Nocardia pseudobrasiliensis]|uniref:CopG family transcriptional regulator n=1 Tax=Nocardia pseudobrasiliensis TaxID=45979 RepID=A0A370HTQ4_9NOCA|nr:hypothetical protein [Nocardia pseudobrasiliensis]RDI61715.1 hypothetical protein DFR76_113217 [Nocardia pseudobrasiliensis]